MKIKFIGVGSAFTTQDYYQSNMLITARSGKDLLVVLALHTNLTGHCSLFLNPRSEKPNECDLSSRDQHDPES